MYDVIIVVRPSLLLSLSFLFLVSFFIFILVRFSVPLCLYFGLFFRLSKPLFWFIFSFLYFGSFSRLSVVNVRQILIYVLPAVGGAVLLIIIAITCWCCKCRNKKRALK